MRALLVIAHPSADSFTHAAADRALQALRSAGHTAYVAGGAVRFDFFTFDPLRIFYVNVDMPPDTPLEKTLEQAVPSVVARETRGPATRRCWSSPSCSQPGVALSFLAASS